MLKRFSAFFVLLTVVLSCGCGRGDAEVAVPHVNVAEQPQITQTEEQKEAELGLDTEAGTVLGEEEVTVMTPEGANDKVVWSSSDEAIATVDQNGLVTGVSVGNVTIKGTITHTDSTLKDLESSLEIAVVAATTSDDVKPQPSGSGGGGCSAGFGALALLAALPLLRMRKK